VFGAAPGEILAFESQALCFGLALAPASLPFGAVFPVLGAWAFLVSAPIGAALPAAVRTGLAPGRAYVADLIGAALGGLLAGSLLLPTHGALMTCLCVAGLLLVMLFHSLLPPLRPQPGETAEA
jgi:hypothetical protein